MQKYKADSIKKNIQQEVIKNEKLAGLAQRQQNKNDGETQVAKETHQPTASTEIIQDNKVEFEIDVPQRKKLYES